MIQVVNRALNILEFVAKDATRGYTLSDIADALEIQRSTCANIIKTLVNRGYIEQSKAKGVYRLGIMIYNLSNENKYYTDLIDLTEDLLVELRNKVNEATILSVIKNYKRIILNELMCTHEIQVRAKKESSVYSATTARMIMAHYTVKDMERIVDKIGLPTGDEWPGVSSKESLLKELEKIKAREILVTLNKNHVIGLAAPIFKNNTIIASIGFYLPDIRYQEHEQKILTEELLRYAAKINKLIS
ncbi:MAG: helix-turn-helix domain-containing protein [Dysgonamonadaceae bacterium]|nr:helix-turn-helix domain-containing protein [Dysgonamonadaceae bacterium]